MGLSPRWSMEHIGSCNPGVVTFLLISDKKQFWLVLNAVNTNINVQEKIGNMMIIKAFNLSRNGVGFF